MIPKHLTIEGLYSYQDKAEIDFELLTESKLFGIFGQVGSGKSSILEAITFALYGRTERLNQKGDNYGYNMMNLKSDKLFVEYEFTAGENESEYKISVKGRRNSKQFEKVGTIERAAYKKIRGEWTPIELRVIENVLGLSYDNFRRTIIIPQGKFQEFLQLGKKDRTQMMKELFGLGKYEFYYQTKALEDKNNESLSKLEGQLTQLGEINIEQLDELKKQQASKKKEAQSLNEKLEAQYKEQAALAKLKELHAEKQQSEAKLKEQTAKESAVKEAEKQLADYEKCLHQFKGLLDSLKEKNTSKKSIALQIEQGTNALKKLRDSLKTKKELVAKLKTDIDKKELVEQEIRDLQLIAKLIEVDKLITKNEVEMKAVARLYTVAEEEQKNIETEKGNTENSIKELKLSMPDLLVLSEIKQWHTHQFNFDKQLKQIEKDKQQKVLEQQAIQQKSEALFADFAFNHMPEMPKETGSAVSKAIGWIQQKMTDATQVAEGLKTKLEALVVKEKLEEYAHALHNGEACPLCGSLEHPNIGKTQNVSKELQEHRKTIQKHEAAQQQGSELIDALRQLQMQHNAVVLYLDEIEAKRVALIKSIESHKAAFIWKQYENAEDLNKAYSEATLKGEQLKKLEKTMAENVAKAEKKKAELEKQSLAINTLKLEQSAKISKQNTYITQIEKLKYEAYKEKHVDEVLELAADKKAKLNAQQAQFDVLNSDMQNIQQESDVLKGQVDANSKLLKSLSVEIKELEHNLAQQLAESGWESLEEIANILAKQIDINNYRERIQAYYTQQETLKNRIKELSAEIGGRVYDAERGKLVENTIVEQKHLLDELNKALGGLNAQITTLDKAIKSQSELLKQHEQLKLRADDIKLIKGMFKSSGFVEFVSAVYLENLCKSANERFQKMTRQRLSLELSEENSFQVRDFMNGGKVRNVKTLSGGQTFQASLAMALALSDNIQRSSGVNENFFFLDEGFGSLDKESLQVVFDTLKSLRKENRIVGVISHVEELQQEIPNYLVVENNEDTGSEVKPSWTR